MDSKSCARINIIVFALFIVLGAASVLHAGILTGKVSDPNGVGVANVAVEFTVTSTGIPFPVPLNLTDPLGNYGILVPDDQYDVEFVTPVGIGGLLPQLHPGITIVGTIPLSITAQWGEALTGFVLDTIGVGADNVDLNVVDALTGAVEYTPNDNSGITGAYGVMVTPGLKNLVFSPKTPGVRLAPTTIKNVNIVNDTSITVSLPAGVFVTGTALDSLGQQVANADLDFDNSITGDRLTTPNDNTDASGAYLITVPVGVYDITIEPQVTDRLVAQRTFSIPVNKDTIIDWSLAGGWSLSGTVTGPGPIESCDIDVVDTVTLAKLVTPGDKTDAAGFYEVIVPTGNYHVSFQPPVATRLASLIKTGVHAGQDTIVSAVLQSGVLLDGTVTSAAGANVDLVDIDLFDAITGATVLVAGDKTNFNGYYAMVVLANTYNLEFEAPKSRRLQPKKILGVSVPVDMTYPVVLDTGLSISGVITASGLPVDSVDVDAIIESSGFSTFQPKDLSDTTGAYEVIIDFVPHTLVYYPLVSTRLAAQAVTGVNPGADAIQNISLNSGFLVSGIVTDPGGAAFPDVAMRAESGGNWVPTTNGTSDAAGGYQTILPAGTYDFLFIPPVISGLDTLRLSGVVITGDQVVNAAFSPLNNPPQLAPIGPRGVLAEANLNFLVTATDVEVPFPSLTAAGLPANATFTDHGNATGTFNFDPTLAQIGSYFVTFEASDGDLIDQEVVKVSVIDPNCDCPFPGDLNADGFVDSVDLGLLVDVTFFSGFDPTDPSCPTSRGDLNFDGFADSIDLGDMIDHVFFSGVPPVNPCSP